MTAILRLGGLKTRTVRRNPHELGRLDERLDDSGRLQSPSGRARIIAAAFVTCVAAAAPATARAADPTALLGQVNAQVNSALGQSGALDASQLATTAISSATGAAQVPVAATPATTPAATAAIADQAVKEALSATSAAPGVPAVGSKTFEAVSPQTPAAQAAQTPRAARLLARKAQRARRHTEGRIAAAPALVPGYAGTAAPSPQFRMSLPSAHVRRSQAARPTRNASAGAEPQRHPPTPLPPAPDLGSAAQGSGQGSVMPLVVAALAAALTMFALTFLPRALPQLAFRRPGRSSLPPWHPG